jgi:hypothetical protein
MVEGERMVARGEAPANSFWLNDAGFKVKQKGNLKFKIMLLGSWNNGADLK